MRPARYFSIIQLSNARVRQRKKNGKYVSEHLDEPPELDIK